MPLNKDSYNTLFLDEKRLKENSIINDAVDMKLLTPIIKSVQEIHLMGILGTSLYVDLQNKIKEGTLNADEVFLMTAYIEGVMIWGVMAEAPLFTTYRFSNKGIEKMNSDNSEPASLEEVEKLADNAKFKFDTYSQRLINYLIANQALFPAYRNGNNSTCDDIHPSFNAYRSNIALGFADYPGYDSEYSFRKYWLHRR